MIIWFLITTFKISVWGHVCRHSRIRTYPLSQSERSEMSQVLVQSGTQPALSNTAISSPHFGYRRFSSLPQVIWCAASQSWKPFGGWNYPTELSPWQEASSELSQRCTAVLNSRSSLESAMHQDQNIRNWLGKNCSCEAQNFIWKKHRVHASLFPSHLQFHPRIIVMLVAFVYYSIQQQVEWGRKHQIWKVFNKTKRFCK